MKKFLLALVILFYQLHSGAQNPFAGDWEGKIAAVRLIFHFTEKDRKWSATVDSPDQGAKGLLCDEVIVSNDSISVTLNIAAASYQGILASDKTSITGTWKQRGSSVSLDLKRSSIGASTEVIKPQTPKPPYPYQSEEVEYDNKDKTVHFGATLTTPNGAGPHPVVIIITGSGTQDRDGTIFGHKIYAVLADYLTRNGVAVLRVDDRGVGKSTMGKDFTKLTSADFSIDVETGISYLQSRTDIDKNNIGLVGHSEGGMIAPMVAARNKNVAFIVLLAGPGQKGKEIWNYQMQRSFEKPGLSVPDKKKADALINKLNNAFAQSDDLKTIQQQIPATYKAWKGTVPDSIEARLFKVPVVAGFFQLTNEIKEGLSWLKFFLNYDPAINLQKVACPVLALNGENDIQILPQNLSYIETALKKGGHKKYTIKTFLQLNHLFQTAETKEQPYGSIEETFSPVALAFISSWIKEQLK